MEIEWKHIGRSMEIELKEVALYKATIMSQSAVPDPWTSLGLENSMIVGCSKCSLTTSLQVARFHW